jgi:hypothetical protein
MATQTTNQNYWKIEVKPSIDSPPGTIFQITKAGALISDVINDLVGDLFDGGDIDEAIPLYYSGIRDETLRQVFALMDLEAAQTKDAVVDRLRAIRDPQTLFEICNIANYLCAEGLLDAVVKRIAQVTSGMSLDQMREFWGYKNDLTPAEQEELALQTSWAIGENL